jgi:hypothetical protein
MPAYNKCEHVTDAATYQGLGFYECRKCHAVVGLSKPPEGYPRETAAPMQHSVYKDTPMDALSKHTRRVLDNIDTPVANPYFKKTDSAYIEEIFTELEAVFTAKQKEYKGGHADTFRNFNQGGKLQNETPEQTLLGYVNKQIVSLFDAKNVNPERLQDVAFVDEKAKDIIIYHIILMAMVRSKATK